MKGPLVPLGDAALSCEGGVCALPGQMPPGKAASAGASDDTGAAVPEETREGRDRREDRDGTG